MLPINVCGIFEIIFASLSLYRRNILPLQMYSIIFLIGACFVAELCAGQSITPTPTGTLVSRTTLDVPVDKYLY